MIFSLDAFEEEREEEYLHDPCRRQPHSIPASICRTAEAPRSPRESQKGLELVIHSRWSDILYTR